MSECSMEPTPHTTYAGACDCHMHVYDAKFPVLPNLAWVPPHRPVSAYREVQQALGLRRAVVVQPSAYGLDHSCTLEAIAHLASLSRHGDHEGQACGIAAVTADVSDAELARLHAGGIRGVRFLMTAAQPLLGWETLAPMAARLHSLGWLVNLQFDGRGMPEREDLLKRLPCKLVIDHIGKFLEPVRPEHASFQSLLRLLDTGRVWVKLSAPYESSKTGAPAYEDVSLLARTLAEKFPERCLWASNWPHPGQAEQPSTLAMYALLFDWARSDAARRKILVDNPAEVYGFV